MTALLELDGVFKAYPGVPPVTALAAVDLKIHWAERTVVLGPSGSGKTTLLHVAGTLERPSQGRQRIASAGRKIAERPHAARAAIQGELSR